MDNLKIRYIMLKKQRMITLHDPIKEAERIVNILLADKEELDAIIVFGTGLGYIIHLLYEKIIKKNQSKIKPYLIYIEADIKIFLTSLKYFDWTELLKDENVKFFLEAEKELIGSFIQTIPTKKIRYYYHRPSFVQKQEYYKQVQNYIGYVLDRKDMNTATFSRFQKLWTKNFINSLPFFLKTNKLNKLNNIGKDTTAIIIAGGPNLERSIDFLKESKDRAVLIAVDTVYKLLKKHNIKPDIIATIDPQYWNYKFLENENITDSIIVTDASVYYKIFQVANPERYFVPNTIFPIVKYFEKNVDRGNLLAGGSVATTAFDTARTIGAKNIILIGLDLSFPNRNTHFRGAFFETNFLTFSNYFSTAEDHSYRYLTHVNLTQIDSTNGKVFSDPKMVLFKKWFDREVPLTNAKVYQPDMGGALIQGTNILKLDKITIEGTKTDFLKELKKLTNDKNHINWDDLLQKIKKFMNKSQEIKSICLKIVNLIDDQGNIKSENIKIVEKEEANLFSDVEREEVARVISSSAQDVLISIAENIQYSSDEKKSAWIKTKNLYSSMVELSSFYIKNFNKLLKIMQNNPNIIM